MKKIAALAATILLGLSYGAAAADVSARGTTTAQFLQLGVGGRAVAMGEAYTAVASGASALYWNPAGLSEVAAHDATFMHADYYGLSTYDYGAYDHKLGEAGAVGLGVQYFTVKPLNETDETGIELGSFQPYDLAVTAGYARTSDGEWFPELQDWSGGVSLKYIQSKILASAKTEAVDLGILSPGYLDGKLKLGLAILNIGGTMKFDEVAESLPLDLNAGAAFRISEKWLASADLGVPKNDRVYAALGTEYWLVSAGRLRMAGRMGVNTRTLGSVDGLTGISFGIGIEYDGLALDYGFVPTGSLGMAHRISLSIKWGAPKSETKSELEIEATRRRIEFLQ